MFVTRFVGSWKVPRRIYGSMRTASRSPQHRGQSANVKQPILDLMKKWAEGVEEVDLQNETQTILDNRSVMNVRLLAAYDKAVQQGLGLILEKVGLEFGKSMEGRSPVVSKAKMKELRDRIADILTGNQSNQTPEEEFFWDAFTDAYRTSEKQ